jgi:ATP-dependent RNA helicase DDX47/RRP3
MTHEDSSVPLAPETASVTFSSLGLNPVLCETCTKVGFRNPTPIQEQAIPPALQGRDLIGLAQTGSGKTAAFALPILHRLLEVGPRACFACILAPTRELAIQIAEQFEALGSSIGVKCAVIVGGVDMMAQAIALSRKPHIIVGTPGRLVDHMENTKGFSLAKLQYLVMDEADRLLDLDFGPEIDKLLNVIPRERTTYLFSATMSTKVAKLQRASLTDPVRVEVSTKYTTAATLQQYYAFIPAKLKDVHLTFLLNDLAGSTAIVFVSTCANAQRLALMLRNLGFPAIPIHGQLNQSQRLGALTKFKTGERSILIATDVASRGLDIPSVDLVVNFDVPGHSKDYIHRVGRTARAGRSGKSVTLVTQYDIELYQRIEELLGKQLPQFPIPSEAIAILQERVQEAQRHALLQLKELESRRRDGKAKPTRGKPGRRED